MYLYYKFNFMVLIFSQKNQNIKSFIQKKNQTMVTNKPIIQPKINPNQNRNMVLLNPSSFLNFNMNNIMNHNKTNCASCGK